MQTLILLQILLASLINAQTALASTNIPQTYQLPLISTSTEAVSEYIKEQAIIYGVDPIMAVKVATLESGLDPTRVGDKGTSKGLWQIHLPAHSDVTTEEALDPIWSTQWSMKEMVKDKGCRIWSTCPPSASP